MVTCASLGVSVTELPVTLLYSLAPLAPTMVPADERSDPQITIQKKLFERVIFLSVGAPLFATLMVSGRMTAAAIFMPIMFFGCAVYLPNGLPPTASVYVAGLMFVQAAMETSTAVTRTSLMRLATGSVQRVHGVRMAVSFYFSVAELLLACDIWHRRGARLWTGVRCLAAIGCALRLVANGLLLNLGDPAETVYLPGNVDFVTSVVFNVACMAIFVHGFSPANRRRISEFMGRDSIVCSLAELPTPPDRVLGATGHVDFPNASVVASDDQSVLTPSEEHAAAESEGCRLSSTLGSQPVERGSLRAKGRRAASHSSLSSAASELGRALADGAAQPSTRVLPSYPLLPQFYDNDAAVRLAAPVRARLQLRVRDGQLVDERGNLLACDGEAVGMYVMDEQGKIFTTLGSDQETLDAQCVRHSSLVAGGPVAAAGILTVARGRVLCLSNESGHYAPPPSCLTAVLEQLRELGVAHLDEVLVEPTRRIEDRKSVV